MKTVLLLLFFFAGAADLVYEVVWTRILVQVVGNTNLAVALVLFAFLMSFSYGSFAASQWSRKPFSVLRRFALLQAGLAFFGLTFPLLAKGLDGLYLFASDWVNPSALRAAFCWLLLLVPGYLMGASFPIMNMLYLRDEETAAVPRAGAVYGAHLLGAAAGAAAAGFILIGHLGLARTGAITAAVNLLILSAALVLRALTDLEPAPAPAHEEEERPPPVFLDEVRSSVIYAAVFCASFVSLALEVLWTRILVFFLGSVTYSFSAMLFVFLLALAAGSWILSGLGRRVNLHLGACGWILVLGGAAVCLSLRVIPELHGVMEALRGGSSGSGIAGFMKGTLTAAALLMFPGALFLGMVTPLAIGIQVRERGDACREAGLIYSVACFGSCLGALAAGWFMVPAFGIKVAVMVSGFMVIAAGLLVLLFSKAIVGAKTLMAGSVLAVLWIVGWFMQQDGLLRRPLILDSHVFQRPGREGRVVLRDPYRDYREGNMCTASVVDDLASREARLYVDAFNAASTGPSYTYMRMMAHLPVLACPQAERALVIAFGTGTTAGSLSLHSRLKEMEVVEISEAVMAMAPRFSSVNRGIGMDSKRDVPPEVRLFVGEDGRDHLKRSKQGYDLITLEPMMPFTPGAVHFYTAEFYSIARDRLNPGGVLCHWIPLNGLPEKDFKLLVNTFVTEMPGSALFLFEDSLILLGFMDPDWKLDLARMKELFGDPVLRGDLDFAGFASPQALAGAYLGDGENLAALLEGQGCMTDDWTPIEYRDFAPAREAFRYIADNLAFLMQADSALTERISKSAGFMKEDQDAMRRHELSARLLMRGREAEARASYGAACSGEPDFSSDWKDYYERAFYLNPDDRRAARKYSHGLLREALSTIQEGQFSSARDLVRKASAIAPELWEIYMAEAYLHLAAGNAQELERIVEGMHQLQPYANLTLAFRAELAKGRGEADAEDRFNQLLEQSGGLGEEDRALMARCLKAREAGEARFAVPSLALVTELLGKGAGGVTETGRRAWSVLQGCDEILLSQAREELLLKLELGGDGLMEAVRGLGFYSGEEVRARLRELYAGSNGSLRAALLESLARAGEEELVIEMLDRGEAPVDLLLKAAQIASDLALTGAVGPLIKLLDSRISSVRTSAWVALISLTGVQFDYDPDAPFEVRRRSLEQWKRWHEMRSGGG